MKEYTMEETIVTGTKMDPETVVLLLEDRVATGG